MASLYNDTPYLYLPTISLYLPIIPNPYKLTRQEKAIKEIQLKYRRGNEYKRHCKKYHIYGGRRVYTRIAVIFNPRTLIIITPPLFFFLSFLPSSADFTSISSSNNCTRTSTSIALLVLLGLFTRFCALSSIYRRSLHSIVPILLLLRFALLKKKLRKRLFSDPVVPEARLLYGQRKTFFAAALFSSFSTNIYTAIEKRYDAEIPISKGLEILVC